ncbi:hypothetical protein HYV74_03005 [Candidatus Uhrbacteria bacterium]|nr:hypothetical protein [Candidatus Uhrbacteria bacterium]
MRNGTLMLWYITCTAGCATTLAGNHEPIAVLHERPPGCRPSQWGAQCLEIVNTLPAPVLICVDGACLRMAGDPNGLMPSGAIAYIRVERQVAAHTLTYTAFDEVRTRHIALRTPSILWRCSLPFSMQPYRRTSWGGHSIRLGQQLADCQMR